MCQSVSYPYRGYRIAYDDKHEFWYVETLDAHRVSTGHMSVFAAEKYIDNILIGFEMF